MGIIILADVTELETIKISELDEALSAAETDVVPIVEGTDTKKIAKSNYLRFLESEYEELSNWLDNVTLGADGLTTVPEIVLTPAVVAPVDIEGGMYYSSLDKFVYVCTNDV